MAQLVELQGTEKQVAWATTIRAKIVARAERVLSDEEWNKPGTESYKEVAEYAFWWMRSQKSATFWINHKDDAGYALLTYFVHETKKRWISEGKGERFLHPNQFMTGDRGPMFVDGATIY